VSCGIREVIGFCPLAEVERRIAKLSKNPRDAEALALRGELRLHNGKRDEAISDLRESVRQQPQPRVKRILAATLMSSLATDPVQFLKTAPEIEALVDAPSQRIDFFRSYVRSLDETGDRVGAVKQLFRLAEPKLAVDEIISDSSDYSITLWQNIRSQLLTIFEAANANQRLEIRQLFEREYQASATAKNRDQRISWFINLMLHHPVGDSLLQRLVESKDLLVDDAARIKLIEQLTLSPDKSVAGFAIATLAAKSLKEEVPREAIPWITELGRRYASQICLNGKTGKQLFDEWSIRDDVTKASAKPAKWPDKPIHCELSRETRDQSAYPVVAMSHVGSHFGGWSFELDTKNRLFTARDPSLRVAWQLQRACFADVSRVLATQLHIRGRRLALSCGTHLIVMEGTESALEPKVLFDQILISHSLAERRSPEPHPKRPLLPNGRRFQSDFDPRGADGFLIGLSDEAVFYQMDNRLIAADVETGTVIWTRTGATYAKSDATVDRLLTLHTTSNDAWLLRPLDGAVLQHHKGSPAEMPLGFRGTRRLSERNQGPDRKVFEMRDFDGDQVVWETQHPAGTLCSIIDQEVFAVLEPSGKLTIFNLESGKTIVNADLPLVRANGASEVLAVQRFADRYLVFAGIPSDKSDLRSGTTFIRVGLSPDSTVAVDGSVCAVNQSDGHVAWSASVGQLAYDYGQPVNVPVLVLASRQSVTNRFGMQRLSALVLDKRNGRVVFETPEPPPRNQETFSTTSRGAQFIPIVDEKKLIVDFQDWNLELTFTDDKK